MDIVRPGFGASPAETVVALGSGARNRRLALRLSQAELAERAGVSVATIARFERGDGGISIATVAAVATALDCDGNLATSFPPIAPVSLRDALMAEPRRRQRAPRRRS